MKRDVRINAVKRSFDIIELLTKLEAAGTSELASHLGLPTSTVNDHLQTLVRLEYVIKEDGEYHISTRFIEMGERRKDQIDIYKTSQHQLDDLAEQTGEHVTLMIEENGYAIMLYTAIGEDAVRLSPYSGTRVPIHRTAPGKVLLAHMDTSRVEEIIDQRGLEESSGRYGLPTRTKNMITDPAKLLAELEEVREREYAVESEELIKGMCSVAVPITASDGTIEGSIGVHGPTSRIDSQQRQEELVQMLNKTANVIEVNLRYT